MSEIYYDPAMQKYREDMQRARRIDARNRAVHKYAAIVVGVAACAALLCFAAYKIYVTF